MFKHVSQSTKETPTINAGLYNITTHSRLSSQIHITRLYGQLYHSLGFIYIVRLVAAYMPMPICIYPIFTGYSMSLIESSGLWPLLHLD